MFRLRKFILPVVVVSLFSTLCLLSRASAQDMDDEMYYEPPARSRSLSQRLEQFRQDLLGDSKADSPSSNKTTNQPQSKASSTTRSQTQNTPAGPNSPKMPTPASRVVAREKQLPANGVRVASKPNGGESKYVEPTPRRAPTAAAPPATPARAEPTPAKQETKQEVAETEENEILDETVLKPMKPTAARPARRGGAFELPTPRVARSQAAETREIENEVEEAPAKTTPVKASKNGNVLFSSKSPLLSVETTGPQKVLVGREAVFTVNVRNVGEVVASGIVVKINIPAYAEVLAADPSSGSAQAPKVSDQPVVMEWKIDRLELRGRESLQLKIVPRKSTPMDMAMQWTCTPETSQAVVEVQEPKLSMSLVGPREVFYGQSKIYKMTIANPGNGDAENVTVSLMPIGRTGDAPSNHRIGILRAGDSKTIDIELTARQAGQLDIKAQAFGEGGLRADVAEQVMVRCAQLKIAIAGSKVKFAGTPSQYRIRVANAGDALAEGVEVAALLPPDSKYLNSSSGGKLDAEHAKVIWNVGMLQPGEERNFEMQCSLSSPGDNSLQTLATAKEDLTATAATSTQVEALADLKLEVRDPQGPVPVGEDTVYEVVIRNRGTKAAEGIDMVTFFSEGLEATNVQGGEHQVGPGQVVMKTIPMISPGNEAVIRVHCKADRGGNLVFRAEVTCKNPGTKLAAEETTHFYGDEAASEEAPAVESAAGR